MTNVKKCADCAMWDYTSGNFGFCRANAPSPQVMVGGQQEYALVWPSTGMDDWCMQFSPSVPPEPVQ